MKRRTIHDEEHNEDYYYESISGRLWYPVEPEEKIEEDEVVEEEGGDAKCLRN